MSNNGWVKLHRQMFDNKLWLSEPFTKAQAWIDLFANANHEAKSFWVRGNEVKLERGQIGWSELTMVSRWCWSKNKVRRFLTWLETEHQIVQQKSQLTTVITILNYDTYQSDKETEQQTIHQKDTRRYTNKNDKNDKKVSPSGEETPKYNPLGIPILDAFKELDPKNGTYYGNTTQRKACDFLIKEYGLDKVLMAVKILPKINDQKLYIQQITTPYELMNNWVKLGNAVRKSVKLKNENIMW